MTIPKLTTYPRQGRLVGARCRIAFNYDIDNAEPGTVIRDDVEAPWLTVLRCDDGRVVLAVECQWSPSEAPR